MKTKFIFFLLIIILSYSSINAQITIRKKNVVEKAIYKPKQFDSLTNLIMQQNPIDYKKYIGYKLFYLPRSKKYQPEYESDNKELLVNYLFSKDTIEIIKKGKIPFDSLIINKAIYKNPRKLKGIALKQYKEKKEEYDNNIDRVKTNIYLPKFYYKKTDITDGTIYGVIGTIPDSIYGKYFKILNIEGKRRYGQKKYKDLEDLDYDNIVSWRMGLKITLLNESNHDTIFWIVDQAREIGKPFFLVPYFEKLQKLYLNKNLVLKDEKTTNYNLQNLIDVNTGEKVKIKYGQVWTCSDISFIETKDSYYLKGYYFLTNGNNEIKIDIDSNLVNDYFILESEFKKIELEKQKKEEQRRKEEEERLRKEKEAKIKFKKDCIAKWGNKIGNYIASGKVVIGMNKEMCIASWGEPIDINRTIIKGNVSEQWVYGWGTYLYFDNGILTAIQD